MRNSKVASLAEAIDTFVGDDAVVALEGFTHLIPFAAGHELIRQEKKGLTLCRLTPDIVADQLAAAGVISKLVFSWMGNPGVGSLHAIRRRIEGSDSRHLAIEEYSHFGMVARYVAGAGNLPFYPLRSYSGSDLPSVNPSIREVRSPFDGEMIHVVPPLNPDVTIVHVQRASAFGDGQIWGIPGCQKEAAFAADSVILTCEEIVSEELIRADANRTMIPGEIVDAVVEVAGGCHPSYAQGYYDRDNEFYLEWDVISRDPRAIEDWLADRVIGTRDHRGYLDKLGAERWGRLAAGSRVSPGVDYGSYR
ncbi:MAG: CoA-transferase [Acidimicrobiia bacterium]